MRSLVVYSVLLSVFSASVAAAELPDSVAVTKALAAGEAVVAKENPAATAKAFLAVLLASEPAAKIRLEMAEATEEALRTDLGFRFGVGEEADEAGQTYVLAFWKAVADHYADDEELKTRYLVRAAQSGLVPWETLQPMLIADGEMVGLRLGLARLSEEPGLIEESKPLLDAVVAFVPKASPEELRELLHTASGLELAEIIAAVKQRFRAEASPEVKKMRESNFVQRVWHGLGLDRTWRKVNALASSYDLGTLAPPVPLPLQREGKGNSPEAYQQAIEVWKKTPPQQRASNEEDPLLWERLGEYEALLEKYPRYADLYWMRAGLLHAAGFTQEAILSLETGMRLGADRDMYELRAQCWVKLGNYQAQALVDANRAISGNDSSKKALQLFCNLAVPGMMKEPALLPISWEPVVAQRLEMLEERHPELMSVALTGDAVAFWVSRGRTARAQAALTRYKARATPAVLAADKRLAAWESGFAEALKVAVFHTLPAPSQPHGVALAAAMSAGDLKQAWSSYQEWIKEQPKAVAPKLYGAAVFADLDAPYLALALIAEAQKLTPTAAEAKALFRVKAFCAANLGEMVAAALAQAAAGDTGEISFYWLTAFVEANQVSAYTRVHERALAVINTDMSDARLMPWAWQTFALTAPTAAVETWRERLFASRRLPGDPEPLKSELTTQVVESERRLQVTWTDALLAGGELSDRGWLLTAKLAAADGREDDAAFAAATWLLGGNSQSPESAAEATWAWARVAAYRDGGTPDEDVLVALHRNPCDVPAMVRAYEAARVAGDVFGAAGHLRRLCLAYGESKIDLPAACNVAVAAADWELLLSVSQAGLAAEPSDDFRSWYHLALVAAGKNKSAETIREQLYDDALKGVVEEVSGWASFMDTQSTYVPILKKGAYADLHAAVRDAENLRSMRQSAAAGLSADFWNSRITDLEPAVKRHLASPSPSIRAHMQFLVGEIDAPAYLKSFDDPDNRTFAQILTVLRRWKISREVELHGNELAEIQSIVFDSQQHLRFRVMAYAMLRLADIVPAPAPLRASDPLLLEDAPAEMLNELRAGRLALVNGSTELLKFMGGSRSERAGKWTYTLPTIPVVMRLSIAPDLPEVALTGLTATNFPDRLKIFAERELKPVIARAAGTFATELAAAGTNQEARWLAYTRVGERLKNLGKAFELDPQLAGAAVMAVMAPVVNKYPTDALVAFSETKVVPPQLVSHLTLEARQSLRIGATAMVNDYHRRRAEGGPAFLNSNSMAAAQKVIMEYPPGSALYSFAKEQLDKGVSPGNLSAIVDNEVRRRMAAAVKKGQQDRLIADFDRAMKQGNMSQAGTAAQQLGGQYYVRWARNDTGARMDELVYARSIATAPDDISALIAEISRRTTMQQQQASRARSSSSSGGSSWDSFKASCSARGDSTAAYQRARDEKNGIRWVKVN